MSKLPSSEGPQSGENNPKPASRAVRHEVRVTSYLVTRFSYGAKGELLRVVRMTLRDGIVERHEYFHYRDADAA